MDTTRKHPLRWRRVAYRMGMRMRHKHELRRRGGETLATIRYRESWAGGPCGWWWSCAGVSTYDAPKSLEECKVEARAAVVALEREKAVE